MQVEMKRDKLKKKIIKNHIDKLQERENNKGFQNVSNKTIL